jgi:hypothetical protein
LRQPPGIAIVVAISSTTNIMQSSTRKSLNEIDRFFPVAEPNNKKLSDNVSTKKKTRFLTLHKNIKPGNHRTESAGRRIDPEPEFLSTRHVLAGAMVNDLRDQCGQHLISCLLIACDDITKFFSGGPGGSATANGARAGPAIEVAGDCDMNNWRTFS